MRIPGISRFAAGAVAFSAIGIAAFLTRDEWMPLFENSTAQVEPGAEEPAVFEKPKLLRLSPQARKNLKLVSKPARTQTYWKKLPIPGVIVDRPGESDRGVTSPATGVVSQVHAFPGDTVRPGDQLFTIRLFSEYLQKTQKDLFSATRETRLIQGQLDRLRPLAQSGSVAKSRIIELENQLKRQEAVIEAHRQDLLTRGLTSSQIEQAKEGRFVTSLNVVAPALVQSSDAVEIQNVGFRLGKRNTTEFAYEVQALAAELGQQVHAGQLLSTLANHQSLYIEGHAFKHEASALEEAAGNSWEIAVEFAEDDPERWPELDQSFHIRHLANSIDTDSRTFDFYIPLKNQARDYRKGDRTFIVWRFRPGQRARLHVPIERLENVFVLPTAAVVREGPEAYVFRQNGDLLNRIPVQVLHEDRMNVVLANDGSITPGLYFAQNAAASLNRVLNAQAASGMQPDVHVHADGTVHGSH